MKILRSAADEIFIVLKNETIKDLDKKKRAQDILGQMNSDKYSQLVNLTKKLTDFTAFTSEEQQDLEDKQMMEGDESPGVAVIFSYNEEIDEEEEEKEEIGFKEEEETIAEEKEK